MGNSCRKNRNKRPRNVSFSNPHLSANKLKLVPAESTSGTDSSPPAIRASRGTRANSVIDKTLPNGDASASAKLSMVSVPGQVTAKKSKKSEPQASSNRTSKTVPVSQETETKPKKSKSSLLPGYMSPKLSRRSGEPRRKSIEPKRHSGGSQSSRKPTKSKSSLISGFMSRNSSLRSAQPPLAKGKESKRPSEGTVKPKKSKSSSQPGYMSPKSSFGSAELPPSEGFRRKSSAGLVSSERPRKARRSTASSAELAQSAKGSKVKRSMSGSSTSGNSDKPKKSKVKGVKPTSTKMLIPDAKKKSKVKSLKSDGFKTQKAQSKGTSYVKKSKVKSTKSNVSQKSMVPGKKSKVKSAKSARSVSGGKLRKMSDNGDTPSVLTTGGKGKKSRNKDLVAKKSRRRSTFGSYKTYNDREAMGLDHPMVLNRVLFENKPVCGNRRRRGSDCELLEQGECPCYCLRKQETEHCHQIF